MTATRKDIKELADRLIETLDSSMTNEKADAIVADVARELYNDVLGIPGGIVAIEGTKGIVCGSFGSMHFGKYKFQERSPDGTQSRTAPEA